jgi:hypothetical protein
VLYKTVVFFVGREKIYYKINKNIEMFVGVAAVAGGGK